MSEDRPIKVISHNQQGGITAGIVNVNAAPPPQLHMREVFANQPSEGGYHSRVELVLESPYPPAVLEVVVKAPSITRIDLVPQRAGMAIFGHSGTRPGVAFTHLQSPSGRMLLDIFTREPSGADIEWDIQ